MGVLDGWKFCPRCACELELERGRGRCRRCGLAVYANPAPTANALCLDDEGHVLLARRARDPYRGRWDLPGGFLEEGEHPLLALRREVREETRLDVEPLDFIGAFVDWYSEDGTGVSTLNLYWTARLSAGEPRPADDVSELAWFASHELPPPEELAFANVAEALAAWRARRGA